MPYAWPFLLTKNPVRGYFTALSPEPVIERGFQRWFRNELNSLATLESPDTQSKVLRDPSGNVFTLYFRSEPARIGDRDLKDAHNRPFLRLYGILTEGGKGVSSHSLANAFAVVAPEIDTVFRNVTKSADVVETQVSQPIKIGSDVTIDKTLLPTIAAALAGAAILLLLLQNASLQSDIRRLNREVGDLLGFINRMSPPARSTAPQSLTQPEPPSPSPSGSLAPAQPTAPVQRR